MSSQTLCYVSLTDYARVASYLIGYYPSKNHHNLWKFVTVFTFIREVLHTLLPLCYLMGNIELK